MNPLVLLLAAGAALALAGRKPRGSPKCGMWTDKHRGLCYDVYDDNLGLFVVTTRFGFYVKEPEGDDPIFQSGLDYPSASSAAQAARAWIDYRLDR